MQLVKVTGPLRASMRKYVGRSFAESFRVACVDAGTNDGRTRLKSTSKALTFFSLSIHLLIAMTEEPVRSLRAKMASEIRAMVAMVRMERREFFFYKKQISDLLCFFQLLTRSDTIVGHTAPQKYTSIVVDRHIRQLYTDSSVLAALDTKHVLRAIPHPCSQKSESLQEAREATLVSFLARLTSRR